jgi:hypothetical protein
MYYCRLPVFDVICISFSNSDRRRRSRTDRCETLLPHEESDRAVVPRIQHAMARIRDEIHPVCHTFRTRKGLEKSGLEKSGSLVREFDHHCQRFVAVEVWKVGNSELLHRGSDRRTQCSLLHCGRIFDERDRMMIRLSQHTEQVPPAHFVWFLHRRLPNDHKGKGPVRPVYLHHIYHCHHFCFSLLSSWSLIDCCVRVCCLLWILGKKGMMRTDENGCKASKCHRLHLASLSCERLRIPGGAKLGWYEG